MRRGGPGVGPILIAVALLAGCAAPRIDQDPFASYAAAVEARDSGDAGRFLALLQPLLASARNHPAVALQHARALAMNGEAAAAIGELHRADAMGWAHELQEDRWLAPLAGHPDFPDLARTLAARFAPTGDVRESIELTTPQLAPEGMAIDPASGDIYVTSMFRPRIVQRRAAGAERVHDSAQFEGLEGMLGVNVDPARDRLLACTSLSDGSQALLEYDLSRERTIGLHRIGEGGPSLCNDIAVLADGRMLVTDSEGGRIWSIDDGAARALNPGGALIYPNGIASDGHRVWVADALSVHCLDPVSGVLRRMDQPPEVSLIGIDGLYHHDGALIAVQNGFVPVRVVRVTLEQERCAASGIELLASGSELLPSPTTGAVDGDSFLVLANSSFDQVADGRLIEGAVLPAPHILRLPIG